MLSGQIALSTSRVVLCMPFPQTLKPKTEIYEKWQKDGRRDLHNCPDVFLIIVTLNYLKGYTKDTLSPLPIYDAGTMKWLGGSPSPLYGRAKVTDTLWNHRPRECPSWLLLTKRQRLFICPLPPLRCISLPGKACKRCLGMLGHCWFWNIDCNDSGRGAYLGANIPAWGESDLLTCVSASATVGHREGVGVGRDRRWRKRDTRIQKKRSRDRKKEWEWERESRPTTGLSRYPHCKGPNGRSFPPSASCSMSTKSLVP